MEAYVDRTLQLRARKRVRRDHSFAVTVVLCVALITATAWAVLAAGWVHGGGGAIVVAVTSVIEAALLAQARAPRIAAAIAAPFLGLAAIVPTTLAAMPPASGQSVGAIAQHYLQAIFTGLASNQDWDFTVGLCAILFLCGYWLGWMVLREHRGVLAVIPVFSVLATNVVNAASPDPIAIPETIAVVLAISVVAAAYLGSLGDRWTASRITAIDGLGWRFGTSAAAVAVVLTIVALVLPPLSTTDISARLFPHGLSLGSTGKGTRTVVTGGANTIGFNPSVTLGGPLVSHPELVMTYTDNTTASEYIRVDNDTVFLNGNWYPQGPSSEGVNAGSGLEYPGGLLPRDTDRADGGIGKDESLITATLTMQPKATGTEPLAPFTGDPVSVNAPGIAWGTEDASDSELDTVDEVTLDQAIQAGTTLRTSAYVSAASTAELEAAGTEYPTWVKQYTNIPDDPSHAVETIRNLANQWIAGVPADAYDEAIAIQNHLRDPAFFQYTLNPPQDPSGAIWPVVYFLTVSNKGYCQYFASAMGSMLRSLGIPARLVSGYGPGTTRAQSGRAGQRQQEVTTSDAHSWVEAYFPGYGWIPFEPTPPSVQGDYQPFPRGQAATVAPTAPPVSSKPVPTAKPGNVNGVDPNSLKTPKAHASLPGAVVVSLAVLGGIVVLAVAALLWMLLPRSLTGTWKRVETLGVISVVARRKAETHRAFAARLARARPGAESALGELATVTARAEFSASGASGNERAQALRIWRRAFFQATLRPRKSPG